MIEGTTDATGRFVEAPLLARLLEAFASSGVISIHTVIAVEGDIDAFYAFE